MTSNALFAVLSALGVISALLAGVLSGVMSATRRGAPTRRDRRLRTVAALSAGAAVVLVLLHLTGVPRVLVVALSVASGGAAVALLALLVSRHVALQHSDDRLRERYATQTARLRELERVGAGSRPRPAPTSRLVEQVMSDGLLSVAYQPVVELDSGTVLGVEALARFDTRPYRPPDVWFAEARECGLGVELELVALDGALEALDRLPEPLFLAVNASPFTLAAPGFVAALERVDAARVVVEVTEHAAVDDYVVLDEALRMLRAAGLRLVIDDTGAGHAGLRHVVGLRPDGIKLDRSLTARLPEDDVARALSGALTSFAFAMGATVVAEGVETAEQEMAVRSIGVRMAQGYRLGAPAPLPEALARARPSQAARERAG